MHHTELAHTCHVMYLYLVNVFLLHLYCGRLPFIKIKIGTEQNKSAVCFYETLGTKGEGHVPNLALHAIISDIWTNRFIIFLTNSFLGMGIQIP